MLVGLRWGKWVLAPLLALIREQVATHGSGVQKEYNVLAPCGDGDVKTTNT